MSTIRRKRATAFWSAFSVLLALLLSACGKADFTFPTYSYVNPLGTSFQNADPAVTLDGILDDAIWKDKRLLELAMKTDPGVTVNMTSYYGTDGLYLAFDVRDPSVYSVKGRDITSNSGIELYISSMEGASDISGHGYEVDLSANGETAVKRYERGSYRSWPVQLHTAVKTDGEMNTPNCKGYVIEAFMPYSMFGGEKAASVYATPAIIRSLSADSDEKRQWYNFGMEDRSASWTQASTWWTFDKDGLVAHDVTLIPGDHGTLTGKSCVVDGDDYIVQIVPDDGYYARSVRVDGRNVAADLLYKNGVAYYRTENVTENLWVETDFEKLPENTAVWKGKITDGAKAVEGAAAFAVVGGYARQILPGADGSYTVEAPAVSGLRVYAEAGGYITNYAAAPAAGGTVNLTLRPLTLGSSGTVSAREFDAQRWDFDRLYQNRVRSLNGGLYQTVMNTEILSDTVFASANIRLPRQEGRDARAGFIFYDQKGHDVFVALTMNNEKGQYNYSVQMISQNGSSWSGQGSLKNIEQDGAIRDKANSAAGVNLSVLYAEGKLNVWVNAQKVGSDLYPVDKDGKALFAGNAKVAVGLQTWQYRASFSNLILRGSGLQPGDKGLLGGWSMNLSASGSGRLEGAGLAADGDLYRFYVTPAAGWYAESVRVNGTDVTAKLRVENGRTYYCIPNVTGDTAITAVFKKVPAATLALRGAVRDGGSAVNGARAWFVKGGYMQAFPLRGDGSYSVRVPDIGGQLYVAADGYVPAYVPVSQAKNGVLDIALVRSFIGSNGQVRHPAFEADNWDLNQLGNGLAQCLSTSLKTTAMNSRIYAERVYASASLTLPRMEGVDTRAGFVFCDKDGHDVFVALTMSNDQGQYSYSVQIISQNGDSWRMHGALKDIGRTASIKNAANSAEGVPFAVLYHNGKLDIWVNNIRVATDCYPTDANDRNLFAPEAKVAVGLQSWNHRTAFSRLTFGESRPLEADWDLSQLSEGIAQCLNDGMMNTAPLDAAYRANRYVQANIELPRAEGIDTRAGFLFKNKSGEDVFVALTMSNEKGQYEYSVQFISRGGTSWSTKGSVGGIDKDAAIKAAAGSSRGVPFGVLADGGTFSVWVNNVKAASGVYPVDAGERSLFAADPAVSVSLHSWNHRTRFSRIILDDARPVSLDWDLSGQAAGTVRSLNTGNFNRVTLDAAAKGPVYIDGSVTLPRQEGKDARAGFRFVDEKGNDVFVALTMNNQKNQYTYALQFISRNGNNWSSKGLVADISGNRDIVAKANSAGGVPFAVLYADGQFTVWLNNERVASQVRPTDKEANIFADDAKVTAGLETWQYGASFTGLFIGSSRPVSRDWDLSRLEGEGTALCTTTDNYATAPLAVPASTRLYASADILLPYRDNDDTRAGFVFKDGQGGDVFVALTMVKKNDETGMPASYALQFISRGATSWAAEGDVLYLGGDAALAEAANSPEGARLEVLYHDGLFDVWVNYSKVATNIKAIADSRPVLAADAAVTVGLQSWSNKTTFYQVTMGRERPANAAWDLTELEDGTVKSRTTDISVAALGRAPGASVYVSSSITLPVVAYDDTRAGYRFTDSDGNNVFIALCMNKTNGTYDVQLISKDGSSWSHSRQDMFDLFSLRADEVRKAAESEAGIPFAVRYHGGKFDIWVNNTLVIADAYPNPDGGNLFSEDDVLTVDLESWRNKTTYSNLTFGETRPEAADWRQTADTSYQSVSLSNNAGLTIDAAGRQKLFVTASMRIPMVDYDDSRAGFLFRRADGMGLFIGLQTVKSRQTYRAIALTLDAAGNTVSWGPLGTIDDIGDNRAIYDAANSDGGVPLAVVYDKGRFDFWINGIRVAGGINGKLADGSALFAETDTAGVSLQSWRNYTAFSEVTVRDSVSAYELKGTVKTYRDGVYTPLANTEITFTGAHDGFSFKLTTDEKGGYAAPAALPMDVYTLRVTDDQWGEARIQLSDGAAKESVLQYGYATVTQGSADLSKMNDADHTIVVNEGGMVRLNTDAAFASSRYYVLSMKLKSLTPLTYDWGRNLGVALASTGKTKDDTYAMMFLYGTNASQNLIKLQNNGKGTGSLGDESFPQDQWYNHPKLEQIFDEGIDIRLVRADSKVYLLACLDGNWEMIGKMLLGSRDNDIQLLNWGTKSVYSSIEIVEGMEAAADALSGYSVGFTGYAAVNYTLNTTQWAMQAKIQDMNPGDTKEHRIATLYATDGKNGYTMSFLKQANATNFMIQRMGDGSGGWGSVTLNDAYSDALRKDGLTVRFVRSGKRYAVLVSLDGVRYEKVFERTDLPEGNLFLQLRSWQASRCENMVFKVGGEAAGWLPI